MQHFTLYGFAGSGNCDKVRFTAAWLGLDYTWKDVAIFDGASRTPAFLRDINPQGQVPAIVFDDGRKLAQSNAIMLYLAQGSPLIPGDPFTRAHMMSWLFWEQYSHEPYIAVCRANLLFRGMRVADLDPLLREKGRGALAYMERALGASDWLTGADFSLADIALYAYTRVAHEGGFDLAGLDAVQAWLDRTHIMLKKKGI